MKIIYISILLLFLSGCSGDYYDKYKQMQRLNSSLQAKNAELKAAVERYRNEAEALKVEIAKYKSGFKSLYSTN